MTSEPNSFLLNFDPKDEVDKICNRIKSLLMQPLKKRGLIIAISGGIDSSTCLALAAKAIGNKKILSLQMPERQSADETIGISKRLAEHFNVEAIHEDITPILESVNFYNRYDDAVRKVIPEYGKGWKSKITVPDVTQHKGFTFFWVIAQNPEGEVFKKRLSLPAYLEIVAATNFKQRIRKMLEYYHADRLNYAVIGTPNRLEYDQGFFVKLGDGAADIKPIAHLYKTQVYSIAKFLGVPEEICNRRPTTDTYSLPQGQDEFYFSLPYEKMDICLFGKNNQIDIEKIANKINLSIEQVKLVLQDIDTKRSTTKYLHLAPILMNEVPEISNR